MTLWPLLFLFAGLPFEVLDPWLDFGWIRFTNLELLLLIALAGWLNWLRQAGREGLPSRGIIFSAAGFLGLGFVSALLAPEGQDHALRYAGRMMLLTAGLFLGYGAVRATRTSRPWVVALCAGGFLSGLLALGEAGGVVLPLLSPFKAAPSFVGGELRVSGTFQYATITSAYFELLLPLFLTVAALGQTRPWRWLGTGAGALALLVVGFTQTRAGLLTVAAILALLLWAAFRWRSLRPLRRPTLLTGLTLLLVPFVLFGIDPARWTRLTTLDTSSWFDATYNAPDLVAPAGSATDVSVVVTNRGRARWSAGATRPYGLAWRWFDGSGTHELDRARGFEPLARAVAPGESATVTVTIETDLPPGSYQLYWDMARRDFLSFHEAGVPSGNSTVTVASSETQFPEPDILEAPGARAIPTALPRRDLWRAALGLFGERPGLGHGPDAFRFLYGPRLGLAEWDLRIHSNNLYLELLANQGLLGLSAFFLVLGVAGRQTWQAARAGLPDPILAACLVASLLGWLGHGFLDQFMGFTGPGLLFWILIGLLMAETDRANSLK